MLSGCLTWTWRWRCLYRLDATDGGKRRRRLHRGRLRGTVNHTEKFCEKRAELVDANLTRKFEGGRIHCCCCGLDVDGLGLEEPKQLNWKR